MNDLTIPNPEFADGQIFLRMSDYLPQRISEMRSRKHEPLSLKKIESRMAEGDYRL